MPSLIVRIVVFSWLWLLLNQVIYSVVHWLIPVASPPGPGHVLYLLDEIIQVLTVFFVLGIVTRQPFKHCLEFYGFTKQGFVKKTLIGFIVSIAFWAFNITIDIVNHRYVILGIYRSHFLTYWSSVLVSFLLTALAEETIFRGYIFQTLERRWGSLGALFCSSFLFGLNHITWTDPLLDRASWFLHGFVAGFFYSSAFLIGRRMWFPLGLHWGWDFAVSLFSHNYSSGQIALFNYRLIPADSYTILGASYWTEMILRLAVGFLLLRIGMNKGHWQKLPTAANQEQRANLEV